MRLMIAGLTLLMSLFFSTATAGDEATVWLEKLAAIYKKAPLSADYRAEMKMNQMGSEMTSVMTGKVTFKDRNHQRMELDIAMTMGENKIQMTMLTVSDGTTLWVDSSMPMGRQVNKMTIADVEDMMKSAGINGLAGGNVSMDQLVESMQESMDVSLVSVKDGKVTLNAVYKEIKIDPENPMAATLAARQDSRMLMILDEKDIFPLEMKIFMPKTETVPNISMVMTNLKMIKESELPAGVFSYTPPEGVQVIDIGAQMKAANQQQSHDH